MLNIDNFSKFQQIELILNIHTINSTKVNLFSKILSHKYVKIEIIKLKSSNMNFKGKKGFICSNSISYLCGNVNNQSIKS